MPILKAAGRSVAVMYFDSRETAGIRRDQVNHLAYHIARLLTGERTADSERKHLGLSIELEPDSDDGPGMLGIQ